MRKPKRYAGQLTFSDRPRTMEKPPTLDNLVHQRNFGIQIPYLLEHLPQYNHYLQKDWMRDVDNDNLLLRTMYGGIKNSKGTPPEIFEGLNTLEICLMEAGIFQRKYVYYGDIVIQPGGQPPKQPIVARRDPKAYSKSSRIKVDGHLEGKSLYEIMIHLLTASAIDPIYNKYKKDWQTIFNTENPNQRQRRFKRVNSNPPEELKDRMDYTEWKYPDAVITFKQVLAEPFIPPRTRGITKHGDPIGGSDRKGFYVPLKTYRRGIKGKSFHNLRDYAERVHAYFQRKERVMQK